MAEELTLPTLPKVSWDSHTQTFANTRKRNRNDVSAPPPIFSNSSDPAIFSSDDDPHVENYVDGRHRKKRYVGSWFQQMPTSSDSTFSEPRTLPKPKREFVRQADSGVWLGSDGSVEQDDGFDVRVEPPESRLAQLQNTRPVPSTAPEELIICKRIDEAIENGDPEVDLTSLGVTSISNGPISRLAELALIPSVYEYAPFEPKSPELGLYLSNNRLIRAPSALFNLEHLTYLSLRNNAIIDIPPAIGNLRHLRELNLSLNRLRYLPGELLGLLQFPSALTSLHIHPNPFHRLMSDLPPHRGPSDRACSEGDVLIPKGSLPFFEGKDMELFVVQDRRTADEILQQMVDCEAQCAWQAAIVGRSPVEYSDSSGTILSRFRLPWNGSDDAQSEQHVILETDDLSTASTPHVPGRAPTNADRPSRVLSLFELALKSASRASKTWDLAACLTPQTPTNIRKGIERIASQSSWNGNSGCLPCSTCGRQVVTPTAQWIEWWDISSNRSYSRNKSTWTLDPLSMNATENAVPFLKRACSWGCGPKAMEVGQCLPGTLRFHTLVEPVTGNTTD
ncbi:hypothetical protein GGS20DRAFT_194260 [Poronia punctata]|nr:hypothetical protein GGS20DRAFT_194260 [Poronia punctata]